MFETWDGITWYLEATGEPVFQMEIKEDYDQGIDRTLLYWYRFHPYQVELHGKHLKKPLFMNKVLANDWRPDSFGGGQWVADVKQSPNLREGMEATYQTYARKAFRQHMINQVVYR